jgi:uncharacterized protein YhdP
LFKKLCIKTIKTIWALFATIVVLLAVIISLLKVLLPYADNYKRDIEEYLFSEFSADVRIGSIGASWQKFGPVLEFKNINLSANEKAPLDLSIRETKVTINFWKSIQEQRLVTGVFRLEGINTFINSDVFFKVRPQSQGTQLFEGLSHLFLRQIEQFEIEDSTILVRHKDGQFQTFQLENFSWFNMGNRHRGQGDVFVDGFSDNSLSIIMDLYGQRRSEIFGQIFVEAKQVDITPWLTQIIGDHISVQSTEGSFKAWSKVSDGLVNEILLDMEKTGVKWLKQQELKQLSVDNAILQWTNKKRGWELLAKDIVLSSNAKPTPPFSLQLNDGKSGLTLYSQEIDVNATTQLFSLFSATKQSTLLANSNVNGRVDKLHLNWPKQGEFAGQIIVSDFSFLPPSKPGAYLGLSDLSLKGAWKGSTGRFVASGENGQLSTANTFAKEIDYQSLKIDTSLKLHDDNLLVSLPHIHLKNDDIELNLAAQYQTRELGYLSVFGEIQGPRQGQISNYLPNHLISSDTIDYLNKSITDGAGKTIHVVLEGIPKYFPFDNVASEPKPKPESTTETSTGFATARDGIFWVNAELVNAHYKFSESWPALVDFNATLTVDKNDMTIQSRSGTLGKMDVADNVQAIIPLDASPSYLELNITPDILRFSEFHELIDTTPLQDSIGDVFQFVRLEGQGRAEVYLLVPLDDSESAKLSGKKGSDYVVSGQVWPQGAGLALPSLDIEFVNVDADVAFNGSTFSISGGKGLWQGLPVSLDVTGNDGPSGYKVDGQLTAQWSKEQITNSVDVPVNAYFDGLTNGSLTVSANIEGDGVYQYFVDSQLDLTDMKYDFIGDIRSKKGSPSSLNISVYGDEIGNNIYVDLDDKVKFVGELPNSTNVIERSVLTIGQAFNEATSLMPDSGFEIAIDLPQVEFDNSLGFVLDILDSIPDSPTAENPNIENQTAMLPAPRKIYGQFKQVNILGQKWQDVRLTADPVDNDWLFNLESEASAKVTVSVPSNVMDSGLDITAKYIHIVTQEDSKSEPIKNSTALINSLPPLKVLCTTCTFNGKPLGKVTMNAFSKDGSMFIEKALMEYQRNTVALNGIWQGDKGAGKTTITGDINSRYFGPWMLDWALDTGIKQSGLTSKLSLTWQGAPHDFAFATLNGEMSFKLGEGYLSEVSDKGARLFSLFSLNSLYRKLKFDFKDVFQKGLFYNDIKGDLLIENGKVFTENIRMDGVAGNMNMRGFTNLNDNTLDYDVTFKPKITSSIPVIAAWLAPGSAGLSLLAGIALDKIIEKADVVSEVRLKITGDLKDPNVQEVKRFTKTIDIPKPQKPKQDGPVNGADQPGGSPENGKGTGSEVPIDSTNGPNSNAKPKQKAGELKPPPKVEKID